MTLPWYHGYLLAMLMGLLFDGTPEAASTIRSPRAGGIDQRGLLLEHVQHLPATEVSADYEDMSLLVAIIAARRGERGYGTSSLCASGYTVPVGVERDLMVMRTLGEFRQLCEVTGIGAHICVHRCGGAHACKNARGHARTNAQPHGGAGLICHERHVRVCMGVCTGQWDDSERPVVLVRGMAGPH